MDQSQGGNPFGRLIEFARPHKTGYIVSVVLAVLGVAFGMRPSLFLTRPQQMSIPKMKQSFRKRLKR